MPRKPQPDSPYRYVNWTSEVIRVRVVMYANYPLCLGKREDLLFERGIDICHERGGCGGTGSVRSSPATSAASA